jgi:hypothetical protein
VDRTRWLRTPAYRSRVRTRSPTRAGPGNFITLWAIWVSSPYGTLTVFRQNSLTLDAVFAYDPMAASYAFSPIGWQGITCGVGDTEDCRFSTSVKYRVDIGQFRIAALWQFGGYDLNNAATGSYQLQLGGDIANLAGGMLSLDAIGSYVQNAVSIGLAGSTLPAVLPQVLTATLSDNSSVMLVGKYSNGPVKLFGGYEFIRYAPPATLLPPLPALLILGVTSPAPAALRSTTRTSTTQLSTPATSYSMYSDWGEIRRHRQFRRDRSLLSLRPAPLWCARQLRRRRGVRKLPWDVRRGFFRCRLAVCEEV